MTSASDPVARARELLAGKNVSKFELYYVHRTGLDIEAKDGKIETFERSEDRAISVRVLIGKRMGFSFSTSFAGQDLARMVDAAIDVASLMPEDRLNDLPDLAPPQEILDLDDAASRSISVKEKTERALELERMARSSDARIRGVRSASIGEVVSTRSLLSHAHSQKLETTSRLFTSSVTCKAEDQGDAQMGGSFRHARAWSKLDWQETAREAALRACELLGATQGPTLRCPVVLRNDVTAELVGFLSESFSAEAISKGRSLLLGREGQRIFSDNISIIDDALLFNGYASRPFDGEGTPSRTLEIVREGVFKTALYDAHFGRKLDKASTGHASRDFRGPPSIAPTNLYLRAGITPMAELLQLAHHGVLVTELMGVHTANPITGEFSLGASGIAIENGRLTRPLRGFAVAGNLLKLLGNVQAVGSDLQFFGSVGAPSILLPELSLGGS